VKIIAKKKKKKVKVLHPSTKDLKMYDIITAQQE